MARFRFVRALAVCLVVAAVFLGLLGGNDVAAQSGKRFSWDRFDVEIDIQPNGDFIVRETNEVRFEGGTFKFGYREIPARRFVYLTDIAVTFDGQPLRRTGGPGGPGTFYRYTADNNTIGIRYFFPEPVTGLHTIVLEYRVQGGLRYYEGGDQLWWKAVYPDRAAPVAASRVTVTLPVQVDPTALVVAAYGHPASWEIADGGRRVIFEAQDIPPGKELEVRVQFPNGIVEGSPAPWQQREDFWIRWGPVANVLIVTAVLFGFLLPLVLWYQRGRDAPVPLAAKYLSEPPDDLPPALVGLLVDEVAGGNEIMATLVDLARRGAIIMEERDKGTIKLLKWTLPQRDITFRLVDPSKCRHRVEEETVREIFGHQKTFSLSEIGAHPRTWQKRIKRLLDQYYKQGVEAGLFPAHPHRVRMTWMIVGFLVAALGFGSGFLVMMLTNRTATEYVPAIMIWIFGSIPMGMVWMFVGTKMPRKTKKGSEAAARWKAFKAYLRDLERYGEIKTAQERWEEYLPYAIALGVAKPFLEALPLTPLHTPRWYRSPHLSRGPSLAQRLGFGGSGSGGGGLQSTSTRLATGVQGLSAGLATAIQSAATSFSSAGGSSASGGFSGGGGGGGGGGGFG